jgi:tRNA(Met) C34 N-acetyltransferase TmcA
MVEQTGPIETPPPDQHHRDRKLGAELQRNAALIAALAGLGGTVVGGGITYLTNKSLENQQLHQQQLQEAMVTRTDAKLAISRYEDFLVSVRTMEQIQLIETPAELPQLPADASDQAAIVGAVSEKELTTLAAADSQVRSTTELVRLEENDPLTNLDRGVLQSDVTVINSAIAVLTPIAER